MKHAKPKKTNWPVIIVTILVVIATIVAFIFAVYYVFEYHQSGLPGYEEKAYFSVEPWTMGVELVTEEPEPTYPLYFEY